MAVIERAVKRWPGGQGGSKEQENVESSSESGSESESESESEPDETMSDSEMYDEMQKEIGSKWFKLDLLLFNYYFCNWSEYKKIDWIKI